MWSDILLCWFALLWWLNVESLFMYLLAFNISSLEKCLFSLSIHLKHLFFFLAVLPWCSVGKRTHLQCGSPGFDPWVGKFPWRRAWQCPCLENPHGQRSLGGYSPWGCKELDTTEWLSLSLHDMWVLSSLTKYQSQTAFIGNAEP